MRGHASTFAMPRRTAALAAVTVILVADWSHADNEPPPYEQTSVIAARPDTGVILGFCVPTGGGLVAVTGANERYGAGRLDARKAVPLAHRVAWFDTVGKEARSIELDFAATVVAAGRKGDVYVAGDGVVVRLSPRGDELGRGSTPQGVKTAEERAELEKAAVQKRDAQVAAYAKQIEQTRVAVAGLEKKIRESEEPDEEADEAERKGDDALAESLKTKKEARLQLARKQLGRMQTQLRMLEATASGIRRQDPAEIVAQAMRKTRQVRAISAFPGGVLVVVGEVSGYGSAVWSLDSRLENPRKVLSGLLGCCGQMDVQVVGERVAIASNRKHCVELCTLDGESVGTVGGRAASGDKGAGFGGCCNPMNTCPGPDGSLLTSESNGVVKRFDASGAFSEVVGKAEIRGGCKNSAIAIEPDGSRLYYLDSDFGKVLVLTKTKNRDARRHSVTTSRNSTSTP